MKSEPLDIADRKFLINRLIQQAPTSTLIREFFKNAEENAMLAPLGQRKVRIYPTEIDGFRKLTFWNTGIGMDENELRTATELSSSINKEKSLDGNFGIGAKVSGLAASPEGIRYRSCKNGVVSEVTLGWDSDQQTYVRFAYELPDGTSDPIIDVTSAIQSLGIKTDFDWTEVVLMGESTSHDTVEFPIGKGKAVERSFVPTAIFKRFASFPDGLEVNVDVAMTKGGGKDATGLSRRLKSLHEVLDKTARHEDVVDASTNVTVRYVHDPKHEGSGHTYSARANPAVGSTTFCALVYKEERYDFKNSKSWSAAAPSFGIPFGSRVLTVEIRLPDKMALPSQYRDTLTFPHDRSQLTSDDFSFLVRELMPEWVKDIIRAETPDQASDLRDLQSDLQALLDELRVPTPVYKSSFEGKPAQSHDQGLAETEPTKIETDEANEREYFGEQVAPAASAPRAAINRKRLAPEGATSSKLARALERAPEIKMLTTEEEIAEKDMKGRAARFYEDAQILFVNCLYPAVDKMARELSTEFPEAADPEEVRAKSIEAARRTMAYRVGKATCFALAKRMLDDWSIKDLQTATSPESLTMAADDYRQSMRDAKSWMRKQVKLEAVAELV